MARSGAPARSVPWAAPGLTGGGPGHQRPRLPSYRPEGGASFRVRWSNTRGRRLRRVRAIVGPVATAQARVATMARDGEGG